MRPDYTLSLWPAKFDEKEAEAQEIISHVHFDAKYRIERVEQLFGLDDAELDETALESDLAQEKQSERTGRHKRADLLKMHAYRDAIRRTQGAYVLYPGDASKRWEGYREMLPGLGAFPLKPGDGDKALESFVHDIAAHVCNRASAGERESYHRYRTREHHAAYSVRDSWDERDDLTGIRSRPPAETHVLVGWCKGEEHLKWVLSKKIYNFRMDTRSGSLRLNPEVSGASYLLLHGEGGKAVSGLLRITSKGPRVLSNSSLVKKSKYPFPLSSKEERYYLVYDVEPALDFDGVGWDYSKLPQRLTGRQSGAPQTITLYELLAIAKARATA